MAGVGKDVIQKVCAVSNSETEKYLSGTSIQDTDDLRRALWKNWNNASKLQELVGQLDAIEPKWMEKMVVPAGGCEPDINHPVFARWLKEMKMLLVEGGEHTTLWFAFSPNLEEAWFDDDLASFNIELHQCPKLRKVHLPNHDKILFSTLQRCVELTEFNWPTDLRVINTAAFVGCNGLRIINIPDSVETIGECAFSDCEGIEEVYIPDSVKTIGNAAFSDCHNLKKVSISGTVDYGRGVFRGCEKVHFEVRTPLEPFHRLDATLLSTDFSLYIADTSPEEHAYLALCGTKPLREFVYLHDERVALLANTCKLVEDYNLKLNKTQIKNLHTLERLAKEEHNISNK